MGPLAAVPPRCYGPAPRNRRSEIRMGLLQHLGLTPLPTMALAGADDAPERRSGGDSDDAPSKGKDKVSAADALDAKLGSALDELGAVLDGVHDDAAAAPLRTQMQKVV